MSHKTMKHDQLDRLFGKLLLTHAAVDEIRLLSKYHYRSWTNQPFVKAWKIAEYCRRGYDPIGIITYAMPVLNCSGRRLATGGFFNGEDKQTRLTRLNNHVRRIGRVVIDPRYRGLGLASRLVAETMPMLGVSMVETTAVMGQISGFFERAGMRRFDLSPRPEAEKLARVLEDAGIDQVLWIDAEAVQEKIDSLSKSKRVYVEKCISRFMGAYGKKRSMPAGDERTRFALSRLNARPAYFAWLNPQKRLAGLNLCVPKMSKNITKQGCIEAEKYI